MMLIELSTGLISFLIGLVLFVAAVVTAGLLIFSKRREDVLTLETKRADSNANLVKVRDTELEDCNKRCAALQAENDELREENEDLTAELRTVTAIKMDELMNFWGQYNNHMADKAQLEQKIRIQQIQIDALNVSNPPNS